MNYLTVLAALLGVHYAHAACQLPPQQDIDWSKVAGKWYQTWTDNVASANLFKCVQTNIRATENGYDLEINGINSNGVKETMHIYYVKKSDGSYVGIFYPEGEDETVLESLIQSHTQDEGKDDNLFVYQVFYTDNDNYLYTLACDPAGNMDFWGFSSSPDPTASEDLEVRTRLAAIGHGWDTVKLHESECETPK